MPEIAIWCQSVSLSVRSDFSAPLWARNTKFGTKDTYVTAVRPEKGFCEIRLFRPPYAPKTSKNPEILVPKIGISFFAVQGAFLHGSSPFLVCKLLWGERRGRQKDFAKFAFLDPQGTPKCRNLVPKMEISVLSQLRVHLFMDPSPSMQTTTPCKPLPHANNHR